MIGKYRLLLLPLLILLMLVALSSVPQAETSGLREEIEHATVVPPHSPKDISTFGDGAPIDLSQQSTSPQQLTQGGCCAYARWSADSEWVLFLNGDDGDKTPGLYAIPRVGGSVELLTERYGVFSADWSYVAYPEAGQVFVERWADNARWTIPSNGREVLIAPDLTQVSWEFGSQRIQSPDRRQTQIWISRIDGSEVRELVTLHGGRSHGWIGGSEALLVSGRLSPPDPAGIWKVDTSSGAALFLFDVENPRSITISPSGEWIAFIVAFDRDPQRNGIWVLKTDGSVVQRLPGFGAYRWRSDGQLLFIPQDMDGQNLRLYHVDIVGGKVWELIEPEATQLAITNNDWSVSPDGSWMLFHSATDRNIWIMELVRP